MRSSSWVGALLGVLCSGVGATAHADWKGSGEAGLVFARGNTSADTANVKINASTEQGAWLHTLGAQGLRATGQDLATGDRQVTAQRFTFTAQSDYRFTERAFTFAGARYDNDRFSGFNYQASLSGGLGYKFIEREETKLSLQLGAGGRQLRNRVTGLVQRDVILRGDANFTQLLTETTQVTNKLTVESGDDNTLVTDELALQLKISSRFALSVGLTVRHNTNPPAPLLKTDKLMTLNLVYSF